MENLQNNIKMEKLNYYTMFLEKNNDFIFIIFLFLLNLKIMENNKEKKYKNSTKNKY